MMFDQETMQDIEAVAKEFGIEAAILAAIAEIESGGRAYAIIEGKAEPLIRFEGHYFDRRLSGDVREQARRQSLASPVAGGIKNPASQAARWKLLKRAVSIKPAAAYESTSWGVGQVMGAHWQWLGFSSVDALVQQARSGVHGQVRLMACFIEKSGLVDVLQKRDWAAFSRVYNGPAYRKNAYDTKLAKAYGRYVGQIKPVTSKVLWFGMRGEDVRQLQEQLVRHGHPLVMDGVFGMQTSRALRDFQKIKKLHVDGAAGAETLAALKLNIPQNKIKLPKFMSDLSAWFSQIFALKA